MLFAINSVTIRKFASMARETPCAKGLEIRMCWSTQTFSQDLDP